MQLPQYPRYESYRDSGLEWLGEIPNGWTLIRLRDVFNFSKGLTITKENLQDTGIPCVNYGEVHSKYPFEVAPERHDLKCVDESYLSESPKSLMRRGDFVFADTSEDLEGAGNFTVLNSDTETFAGYHTIIARPIAGISPRFLAYVLASETARNQTRRKVKGVKVFSVTNALLKSNSAWFPDLPDQQAIARFLDDKTDKIDRAVKIKEGQIALLRERKQIIIQEAVTKGLNPNVPMKDSGIDWFGQIPAHWNRLANKFIFRLKKDTVGKRAPEYDLLSLTLRGIIKRDMENPEGKFPAEFDAYQEVLPGDFVFCHFDVEETPRTVGLSDFRGMITGAYTVYHTSDEFDRRFLLYFYLFADTDKKLRSLYKGLRNTIPKDVFGSFKTPLPPLEEQQEIVKYIDESSAKVEAAIELKQRQIEALKEYKATLINAAVTGKIKVI